MWALVWRYRLPADCAWASLTEAVAAVAGFAELPTRDVSYAGLKDEDLPPTARRDRHCWRSADRTRLDTVWHSQHISLDHPGPELCREVVKGIESGR